MPSYAERPTLPPLHTLNLLPASYESRRRTTTPFDSYEQMNDSWQSRRRVSTCSSTRTPSPSPSDSSTLSSPGNKVTLVPCASIDEADAVIVVPTLPDGGKGFLVTGHALAQLRLPQRQLAKDTMPEVTAEKEINPYELLGLDDQATEQDIRTAYRQTSRKVHPDRNRNDPDAARKFHELTQAHELLLDPLRRLALDAKLRAKHAREARFKTYDTKRKNMVTELEERERAFKKAKLDQEAEEIKNRTENDKIKDAGRRMREERENALKQKEAEARKQPGDEDEAPSLNPHDTTVRLKFKLSAYPDLATSEALSKLLAQFGATDTESIVVSCKPPKKTPDKPPKYATALVPFKQIGDAFAAVCASGRAERGLDGIEISWVGGKEPEIMGWLKRMGKLSAQPLPRAASPPPGQAAQLPQTAPSAGSAFSSFPTSFVSPNNRFSGSVKLMSSCQPTEPAASHAASTPAAAPGIDYEALTLMRLRQAERERLEREILEQEAFEG
ncbi:J domain-containing protein [Mycena chlorophos]|uniref:J domain-containing protein n=1 Tax=Mycena chlorophos TaxID=658473 RepID=A0A8H6TKL2_MYCCL|nr:J domain-containing protein [Mycena chlorophos]